MHLEKTPNRFKPEKLDVYPSDAYCHHWLSCEKTIMAMAMIRIRREFLAHPEWSARLVNMIHDELNIVCLEKYAEIVAEIADKIVYEEFHYYIKDTKVTWDDWRDAIADKWSEK